MEIEHINDDTIRVTIRRNDLDEMGVSFVELMTDQRRVEAFFHQIIDEADLGDQFKDTESVMFQVMPNAEGFDLIISKEPYVNEDLIKDFDHVPSEDWKLLEELAKEKKQQKDEATENEEASIFPIFEFANFESLLQLAARLTDHPSETFLLKMKDKYYLIFDDESVLSDEAAVEIDFAVVLEYGTQTPYTPEYVLEHGELLIDGNVFEILREYF